MAAMSKKALIVLSLSLLTAGSEWSLAQDTTLILTYPGSEGPTNCQFTSPTGVSADNLGRLLVTGTFATIGCPSATNISPAPVIVPSTSDWALPSSMTVGQTATVQWAAVNATTCTYNGSFPAGGVLSNWPVGSTACAGTGCESLKTVNLTPTQAGTYTFALTCSGNGTVTSPVRSTTVTALPVSPAVIVSGPSDWAVSGWTVGQPNSFNWSANNAASCSFSGSFPSGVTLANFVSGTTSCGNSTACASSHPVTLTPSVAGSYSLTMSCQNSVGATVNSANSWTVSAAGEACIAPSGFTRITTNGKAWYNGTNSGNSINVDLTKFEEVWGRAGQFDTNTLLWPGTTANLAGPGIDINKYVAMKFRTTSALHLQTLQVDATSFSNMGGGVIGGPPDRASMSMTVSTKCGDFTTTTPQAGGFTPPGCAVSNMRTNSNIFITNDASIGGACVLQSNTDYYLNIVYAPLPNPTAAGATANNCASAPCRVNFVQNVVY